MTRMRNRVDAVERALSILDAFGPEDRGLSLAALSVRTGLYKSTILRLIGSLERLEYVRRTESSTYRLGPSLGRLGALYRLHDDLAELIRLQLRILVEKTDETAAFFVRAGDHRLCLYRLNSSKPVRHHLDEGAMLPLDHGATGRVLLAFSGEPGTFYDEIRGKGYYFSRGERDPDAAAIAVPVFDRDSMLRGALSVSALITRLGEKEAENTLGALRESADALQATLGSSDDLTI